MRNKLALVGGIILIVLAVIAVGAPWMAPHDPLQVNLPDALLPPSATYPLGTDQLAVTCLAGSSTARASRC